MTTEIADAYIALYAKMPGVKNDITNALGGSEVSGAVEKSGKGMGGKLLGGLSSVVKGGVIAVGATMAAGIGVALVKGFGRLQAIDGADKKLTGLGHSAEAVDQIMQNAMASVRGTAFGLGDASGVAASIVAAGIKPGEELEKVLKSVANSAAAAGTDLGDMGSIYSKVASVGKAQNDVLQQVADRGVPIYQALGTQLGVTTEEVFKMASAGKIGFAEFEQAMTSASGTVAEEMGKTLPGATANFFASLGRIGANLMSGIYPFLGPLVAAVTAALSPLEGRAAEIGQKIADLVGPGLQFITDTLNGGFDLSGFLDILSVLSPLGMAFKVLEPILPMLLDSFMQIAGVVGGAVSEVFQAILPTIIELAGVFSGVLATVLPTLLPVIQQLAGVFGEVLVAVAPLVGELVGALLPVVGLLVPVIAALLPPFMALISALMPIVQAILPILSTLIQQLAPIFLMLVAAVLPLLTPILSLITPLLDLVMIILPPLVQLIGFLATVIATGLQLALSYLIPMITGVVDAISSFLIPIIDYLVGHFEALTTFLTGVFTGNWEMAWQGVQDIFSNMWQGMQDIGKGAINFIIDLINSAIAGINGLAGGISDLTGGAIDLKIGEIPRLAEGGIVSKRPGGMTAVIGEGRYDEAVVPLSPGVLSQLGGGGSGPSIELNVYGDKNQSAAEIGQISMNALNEELRGL